MLMDEGIVRSPVELEKWLFNWELEHLAAQPSMVSSEIYPNFWGISGWGDEMEYRTVSLLLLPTQNSWETLAYLHWYGSAETGTTVAIAFLKKWHQQYGVELVCHFYTILKLLINRKPSGIEEALQITWEHYAIAPCTFVLSGELLRDYSRALLVLDGWDLHERP